MADSTPAEPREFDLRNGVIKFIEGHLIVRDKFGRLRRRYTPSEALVFLALLENCLEAKDLGVIYIGGDMTAQYLEVKKEAFMHCRVNRSGAGFAFNFSRSMTHLLRQELHRVLGVEQTAAGLANWSGFDEYGSLRWCGPGPRPDFA